jgi:hypothetical protein
MHLFDLGDDVVEQIVQRVYDLALAHTCRHLRTMHQRLHSYRTRWPYSPTTIRQEFTMRLVSYFGETHSATHSSTVMSTRLSLRPVTDTGTDHIGKTDKEVADQYANTPTRAQLYFGVRSMCAYYVELQFVVDGLRTTLPPQWIDFESQIVVPVTMTRSYCEVVVLIRVRGFFYATPAYLEHVSTERAECLNAWWRDAQALK